MVGIPAPPTDLPFPSPRRSRPVLAFAVTLAVVAAPLLARQQEGPSPLPGVFSEVVEVRVVDLEVVVTDRDGVRVQGLKPGDFRLSVDGEEVALDHFSEVADGVVGPRPEAGGPAPVPRLASGEPAGVSWLVFVDDLFAIARDRDLVLRIMADDLPSFLGPADRMAVVGFDGRQLTMLTSWSSSVPALQEALRAARERPAYGLQRLSERRSLSDTGVDFEGAYEDRLGPQERYYADLVVSQVERSVRAAAATVRSFAEPPGRKVLLLLSGGWPFDVLRWVRSDRTMLLLDRSVPGGEELLQPLVDAVNKVGYTIYPVDVPGMRSDLAGIGRTAGPTVGGVDPAFMAEQEQHASLEHLAGQSGGVALLNGARGDVMQRVSGDLRSYYWLGFTPRWKGDDQRHDIRLEVLRPGLEVRNRGDYLDVSREALVGMAVESALLFGNAPSGRSLGLTVSNPRRARLRLMKVDLSVEIPLDAVTFLPDGDSWVSRLELRIAARDERGATSEIPVIPLQLSRDTAPVEGQAAIYRVSVELRRIRQELVVAVYDPFSGGLLAGTVEVAP